MLNIPNEFWIGIFILAILLLIYVVSKTVQAQKDASLLHESEQGSSAQTYLCPHCRDQRGFMVGGDYGNGPFQWWEPCSYCQNTEETSKK